MKQITPDHHPAFIAVLDGKHDLAATLLQARARLMKPQYQGVVITRDNSSLVETAQRSEAMLNRLSAHYNAVGCLADGRFAELGMSERILETYDTQAFEKHAGLDVAHVLTAIKAAFASAPTLDIRCVDGANVFAHIDSGHEYEAANDSVSKIFSNHSASVPAMPGGVTLTISLRGGGSVLTQISPKEVRRTRGDAGSMVWELYRTEDFIDDEKGWQVRDGDICLMRAADWPETHLPSLHSSPARAHPENPQERLVGVAFL